MTTLTKLSARLNRAPLREATKPHRHIQIPRFFLMSDARRLPDPGPALPAVPKGGCVILRHPHSRQLEHLAAHVLPRARALGLRVLIASDVRLALKVGADGVHLSQHAAQRGPLRVCALPPGFLITAAAHNRMAIYRAQRAGAHAVLLSPVFPTASHPQARSLGLLRFSNLARTSALAVIALGGVTPRNIARLANVHGFAAIGAWLNTTPI